MKKSLRYLLVICIVSSANAQLMQAPLKKVYTASASELIFSFGNVKDPKLDVSNILRFSCFLHLQQQVHFNLYKNIGIYSGLSIRNVGFINDLNDTIKLKQRVYTLGLPLAIKLGNMSSSSYASIGVEGELAFHYKQKVFVNDEKSRTSLWFSNRTNIFLPSAFAEIKFKQGTYVRFKYYLNDFLIGKNQKINVSGVDFKPTESTLFYVSLGFVLPSYKKKSTVSPSGNQTL
jgi:hypothetical protein